MAIRAYKLAEELGIERNEFVEQARQYGVDLKSAMASLEDAEVELLREKLGGAAKTRGSVDEQRLEGKSGTTVVRRRKRKEPEPEPTPEPIAAALDETHPLANEPEAEDQDGLEAPDEDDQIGDEDDEIGPIEPAVVVAPPSAPMVRTGPALQGPTGPAALTGLGGLRDARGLSTTTTDASAGPDRKGKQRKRVREVVNLQEQEQFAKQITSRTVGPRRVPVSTARPIINPRARRRDKLSPKPSAASLANQTKQVRVSGEISVGDLAKQAGVKAPLIQGRLMALGIMVGINQRIDFETVSKLASGMGFEALNVGFNEAQYLEPETDEAAEVEGGFVRPPVITVMGHVDHGKTSLLDAIRKTKVAEGEHGGITQHVGAYQVEAGGHRLTFIDTPGHAAFTAMRARGAAATDLVVLVIAATEGVMPQTVEAIQHAQAAGCPIVVAINKCDLPDADPARARQRLMEHNLVPEDFGGDVVCCDVSAKTGAGLEHLLEMLALQSEILELRADPARRAVGVVLEAELDKGRGPVATLLVQDGTLEQGDTIVVGTEWGRVRQMQDDAGKSVKQAGPSMPVQITGLSGVPSAGAKFNVVESERVARQIVDHREDRVRDRVVTTRPKMSLEEFLAQSTTEGPKELSLVLKADVQGTCEAARDALEKLSTDAVTLKVLSSGVGAITENDVNLAAASGAIVVGFNVRPDPSARREADNAGVEIRTYSIIMAMLDDVRAAMAGLLPPIVSENLLGRAEIRETFTIPKIGTIAGSYVLEGKVVRNAPCRVVRDGIQLYQGTISSLRRFKDDVREVTNGMECGIGVSNYNDVKIGDVIETFERVERAATL
ncbi:MAG: translation initiation factor IF-2 [Deltaproteobacteria bacterium]|nr:translation initiation factor IF-2 [Deltaproteobacteria bacterium]